MTRPVKLRPKNNTWFVVRCDYCARELGSLAPILTNRSQLVVMNMNPLETYLTNLAEIRSSGATVKETSAYGPLANLLNAIGDTLKPKVRCLIQLKNSGAGMPDGGFFTPDQLKNKDEDAPLLGHPQPARGVIEVKSTKEEIDDIVKSKQVKDYLSYYGQVLVTNYRDFVLLQRSPSGGVLELESFRLAENEATFWATTAHPHKAAAVLGERLSEYLKRILLYAAPLNNPRDVAFFLASYARDARARVEIAGDLPALTAVRTALEEALGMRFEAEKGEHFFRSTLVQTLFYGVFSAWVLWHKEKPLRTDRFEWKMAAWTLHVPMIKALFDQIATPSQLGPLGLVEMLDWTEAALNRVDRTAFYKNFVEDHAVQYFYEPFLEAFDPELRKELGVWYTPPEIVEYMVARVDTALREELEIPDGLADPRVFVLDPCCGTGAYLVEVLKRIETTLKNNKGEDALANEEIKQAAMKRVFGFEILPAPFVVAHLQMGLLLQNLSVPLNDAKNERAGIFLTNALTGWDFIGQNPQLQNWPELEAERAGAGKIKQEKPILVIIGNPPYNAYAGISPEEEQGLVEPYKSGLISKWGIKKFNMDELYVRFFRLAERRIAEKTGKGIVCYVSNFSYLGDPSFVVMRERFLKEFDALWFDCLNGDSRETGKLTPDGKPDPSVFSTEYNREGIRVGTAIGLMVRRPVREKKPQLLYRQFWGVNKRAELLESLNADKFDAQYEKIKPKEDNRLSFFPSNVNADYLSWPTLVELCAEAPSNGLMEKRAGALIDIDRTALESRLQKYYDSEVDWQLLKALGTGLTTNAARFDAKKAREKIIGAENYQATHLKRYALRPMDTRWCYYSSERPLWNEPRPTLWAQNWDGNTFLMSRPAGVANPEGYPLCYTPLLGDNDFLRGHAYYFPLRLRAVGKSKSKKEEGDGDALGSILREATPIKKDLIKTTANLSFAARAYLTNVGLKNPDADEETATLLWVHALAIAYSPLYLATNADGIREKWPRIPLPSSKAALEASAKLGRQVAALLNSESSLPGVDTGKIRSELVQIAAIARLSGKALDLSLTTGWGHVTRDGVTMPGKGKLVERADSDNAFPAILGNKVYDIYLNETACWQNVPEKVWEYTIGGYQVIKKWLSYRGNKSLDSQYENH